MAACGCENWTARHDFMPPSPKLRVTASCHCPDGYRLELRRHDPQGINPRELLLTLVEMSDPAATGGEQEVVYTEHTDSAYDTVSIVPGGPSSVRVEQVD